MRRRRSPDSRQSGPGQRASECGRSYRAPRPWNAYIERWSARCLFKWPCSRVRYHLQRNTLQGRCSACGRVHAAERPGCWPAPHCGEAWAWWPTGRGWRRRARPSRTSCACSWACRWRSWTRWGRSAGLSGHKKRWVVRLPAVGLPSCGFTSTRSPGVIVTSYTTVRGSGVAACCGEALTARGVCVTATWRHERGFHAVVLPLTARIVELRTGITPAQLDEGEAAGRGAWLARLEVMRGAWNAFLAARKSSAAGGGAE